MNRLKNFLLISLIINIFCNKASTQNQEVHFDKSSQTVKRNLVVLGDSLTEGYGVSIESAFPFLLEKKIKEYSLKKAEWNVINSGISGSTTASALGRMKWIFKSKPDLVLLLLGANDGLRGLKVTASKDNLKKTIQFARSNKIEIVLGGIYLPPNYGKEYTKEFYKMYEDLAKSEKVKLIPFLLKGVAGEAKFNLADGIHPNEKGHQIIAETVFDGLKELL